VEAPLRLDDHDRLRVPALLWGVAVGNIVQGVPIDADKNFTGSLFTLLNPYGLWVGVTTLLLFFLHGVYFVA
jgi:cytochrome d ubiquinol oxidase subunit II